MRHGRPSGASTHGLHLSDLRAQLEAGHLQATVTGGEAIGLVSDLSERQVGSALAGGRIPLAGTHAWST